MVGALRICLCTLFGLAAARQGATVTPMEKVISLLKDLSSKVAAEGAKEAAAYDKFACFCKEQADEKLYSIEKSENKIADLKAQIKELDTAIAELNADISKLSKKISGLESEIETKTNKRAKEHARYLAQAKDMNEAIEACGAAIDALKGSKEDMSGAKLDLAQVKKATGGLVKAMSKIQAAPKFEYQSNDIIATLEGLLATFKKMKKDLDFQEADVRSAFDSAVLGLANEKKFAEKERAEKQAVVESKTEELEAAKSDKDGENKDKDADNSFMNELTSECETTAVLFDSRSKTRADELRTLSEATAELEKGAVPNFSANKQLVGLQKGSIVQKAKVSMSFVQIHSDQHQHASKQVMLSKIVDILHGAAGRTHSTALAAVTMRIKMAEDHFVKVRALINDLIEKLKADALAESSQKKICDTGMKEAISGRDEANGNMEVASSTITTLTAKKNDLTSSISTLQSDIAELQKALLERTELRDEEKAENEKTVEMSQEAIDSVKMALGLLQDFYNKALFTQTAKYTPPKADRDGNTLGDLAPEVFDDKYHGSQSESKGIVGILEVILSDFARTNGQTKKDDEESEKEFAKFEKETKDDVAEKETKIETAEGDLSETKSNILDQEKNLSDAKDLLESSLKKLEDLEVMCVQGEETWEERKKKREQEIEALKDALATLEEWQQS